MARFDTNRSAEMEVFVRVVDLGGFTQAARKLRLTPSGVSKLISRLETRLGSRLINRTTRKLTLTEEGQAFYQRAVRILGEMEEAEREAASGAAPRGRLTVNCNIPFGMLHVLPLIPRFLERHPEVTLDLVLTDTLIDLMQERADIAIRVGPLKASRLVARKLGTSRMVVVGTPNYLARFGTPKTPADLTEHRGIGWTFPRIRGGWPFRRGDRTEEAMPPPAARASDGEIARRLALGGVGLARLALFHIGPDIESGRLVPVLQSYNPGDREDIHAVYVGHTAPLPARVRAFIDFLAEHVRVNDPALKRAGDGKWRVA
ncbi:LysR family transcriptional regulator [Bradyrhizobium barranii subsp. apii]|uniref:LysR family transcriptional regulator n=1 Tax=Bradyrhizobium barranii subsp. apii TaxID=2819348 RepID=A0A8T5V028_9BRAD|nr:LysR family transcriptional regulator [Bradyrhizobium barranii]UPT88017.1 LysR family transcriptional regulator [Bradyrhizobium barranii subsp. apii]UPT96627.1 LysR family transcriptional regulator [Bradyrhizobium barranii subsp. apii]